MMTITRKLWVVLVCVVAQYGWADSPRLDAPRTYNELPQRCEAFRGATIDAGLIGADTGTGSGPATVIEASWEESKSLRVSDGGPTPAARIQPALPAYCRLIGRIAPVNAGSSEILFRVNLPLTWNGRLVQYGGGGFNGVLITGTGLVPGQPYDYPVPLARGFVTVGTDSGHQNKPGEPLQRFALDDEALVNFAHASYKKVRDVAIELVRRAYGAPPERQYFVGSSEGGREGLVMAQRYPDAFDGIYSRVPVLNWTGLQHTGLRDGLALARGGWMNRAHTELVGRAVLAACDALDGLADGIVGDPLACRERFDIDALACGAVGAGTPPHGCLTQSQIAAIRTLMSPLVMPFGLANGVREYPGRGPSGEAIPASGAAGGWVSWWLGEMPPDFPPSAPPKNGIAWYYGAGAIQYFFARDPALDVRKYDPREYRDRVMYISRLMDATDPDLSAFAARGGKLIMFEYMGDYAQSPYAGIQYFEGVERRLGADRVAEFARLYVAPNVDHVGTGAPALVDMLDVLVDWVERGRAPATLTVVEQADKPPFAVIRSRPLCRWPEVPRYRGGDQTKAESFVCTR
ncbi:tannase/feruloyl esterase family alpha/beta hydrolase [Tepidimonas aquatica]|uniref:Mono(2-hydroxyethyl) terephthalate hydrolase n=1 Tax=Tepidimonas aquatica TaxID=247482 RepID=A0A554WIU4_9BURK|nr:tannase/feruloyl esterase family alpha/beta hydrolase [Tepidimonas aquatica]TSE23494.1 Mono(2-hydroxyethyl) terephthalate hydrolase [Tepidimonas aquatica]